jgi:hypothetical protein
MAVIGATQLEPVNTLGSFVQGMELGRANRLARAQEAAAQMQAQREAEMRNYLATADLESPEVQNRLLQFGEPGAKMAQSLATIGAQRAQQEKSFLDIDTAKKQESAKAYQRLVDFISSANQKTYPQLYQQAVQMAGGADKLAEMGITEQYDPALLSSLAQSFISQSDRVNQQLRAREIRTSEGRLAVDETRARLEQRRVELEERKAEPGYQEIKIDTKERGKREAAFPKANSAFNAATRDISSLVNDLETLKNHPGLPAITGGVQGRLPSVSKDATAAQALLDKILAKGQFRSLQQLRDNSPTGGAVGNVSDAEGKALRDSFGALSQTQQDEDFRSQIDSVISDLQFAGRNINDAFNETYSYRGETTKPSTGRRGDPSLRKGSEVIAEADRILGL